MSLDRISVVQQMASGARERMVPHGYQVLSTSIPGLLVEAMQLAKLVATEERDLASIRADFALRIRQLDDNREKALLLITNEYRERSEQIALLNENVRLLIQLHQFEIAQQIMNRMADILSDSPLRRALPVR